MSVWQKEPQHSVMSCHALGLLRGSLTSWLEGVGRSSAQSGSPVGVQGIWGRSGPALLPHSSLLPVWWHGLNVICKVMPAWYMGCFEFDHICNGISDLSLNQLLLKCIYEFLSHSLFATDWPGLWQQQKEPDQSLLSWRSAHQCAAPRSSAGRSIRVCLYKLVRCSPMWRTQDKTFYTFCLFYSLFCIIYWKGRWITKLKEHDII